jgi:transcriptional regulator with XRE-family HTH domain
VVRLKIRVVAEPDEFQPSPRDLKLGRALRVLRRRKSLGQIGLARNAGVSHTVVSRLERGHVQGVTVKVLRTVFEALGASVSITPFWEGAALDRLLDEEHALLGGRFSQVLQKHGWAVETEVSYSRYGERGSIDLLAYHVPSATALVVEIKTALGSVEETVRRLDAKQRLAPAIVFDRQGWRPRHVGRVLVLAGGATAYRHVERFGALLDLAFPARAREARHWLTAPSGAISALWLLSPPKPAKESRVQPVG